MLPILIPTLLPVVAGLVRVTSNGRSVRISSTFPLQNLQVKIEIEVSRR